MLRRTLIIGLAASLSGCGPHYDQKEAERYIVDSERQWAESVANGDTTVLERILADDFVGVDPKGPFYDKAKMIADTREAPKYFASNHLNAVKVRFYGDTAVAQGQRDMGAAERRTWTLRLDRHVGATER
jgi:ketosteroid isomerase-like protein